MSVSYPPVEYAVALAEALTYPLEADHRATLVNEFENMYEALDELEIVPDLVNGGAMVVRDLDGAAVHDRQAEDALWAEVATRRAVVAAEVATRRDALMAKRLTQWTGRSRERDCDARLAGLPLRPC